MMRTPVEKLFEIYSPYIFTQPLNKFRTKLSSKCNIDTNLRIDQFQYNIA